MTHTPRLSEVALTLPSFTIDIASPALLVAIRTSMTAVSATASLRTSGVYPRRIFRCLRARTSMWSTKDRQLIECDPDGERQYAP